VDYPFTVPGYEHVPLALRASAWGASQILYNGAPLEKTGVGKFRLAFSDGSQLDLQVKPGGLTFTPQVVHGNDVIKPVPPLPGYAFVFIYLPLALIAFGGAVGGGCGGAAAAINAGIFRSEQPTALKIVFSLLAAMGAVMLWLVIGVIITLAVHPS
jgi:hypothetical protein